MLNLFPPQLVSFLEKLLRSRFQVLRTHKLRLYCFIIHFSDVYEGTRMATVTDLSGIRQVIQPLEAYGTLVQRTDEEVCATTFSFLKFASVSMYLFSSPRQMLSVYYINFLVSLT